MPNEDAMERKKLAERARKAKIKNDPALFEIFKEKDRQRYHKRKREGKIKPIHKMSQQKQKIMREKSRESSRKHRAKKQSRKNDEISIDLPVYIETVDKENHDPLNLSAPSTPTISFVQEPASPLSMISISRAASPALSTPRSSRLSTPVPLSPMSNSSISQRLRSNILKKLLVPQTHENAQTPRKPSKASLIRKLRYRSDKEKQIYTQKISKLKTEKDCYRKQIIRMRQKSHILQEAIRKLKTKTDTSNSETSTKLKATDITPQIKVNTQNFYEDDENSRMCPGKKDTITQNKIKKQKRYLNDSLQNLHQKFLAENPGCDIGYSTFCKLRPFWILIPNVNQRETCLCQTHENFDLIVAALKKHQIIYEKSVQEVLTSLCCDRTNVKCLSRKCENCKEKHLAYKGFDDSKEIHYFTWKKEKKCYTKDGEQKTTFQMAKHKVIAKPQDLIEEFDRILGSYMQHEANLISQRKFIKKLKADLLEDQCIIHCDFSENYNTKYASEIQSFHFGSSRKQITLHTSVVYYKKDNETRTQSYCTLSDCLRHDAIAIWEHLQPIFRFLEKEAPQLESLFFISDSPSAQYRNRKMFFIMSTLHWNFPSLKCVEWNYTEVGHGKGAPDGVGGCIKRTADRIVARGNDIKDLQSLVGYLKSQESNIIIDVVEESNIYEKEMLIPIDLHEFPGTFSVHQVIWNASNRKHLAMRKLSCGVEECLHKSIECHHGHHIGFYCIDKTDQKEVNKTNTKCKNKARNLNLVKSSKVKPIITENVLIKPANSITNKNETQKKMSKDAQKGINDIEKSLPTSRISKVNDTSKIKVIKLKNHDSTKNMSKLTEQNVSRNQSLEFSVADLEITENDTFWTDISMTDIEGIMTPSLTKTVVDKLTHGGPSAKTFQQDTMSSDKEFDIKKLRSRNTKLKTLTQSGPSRFLEQNMSSSDEEYKSAKVLQQDTKSSDEEFDLKKLRSCNTKFKTLTQSGPSRFREQDVEGIMTPSLTKTAVEDKLTQSRPSAKFLQQDTKSSDEEFDLKILRSRNTKLKTLTQSGPSRFLEQDTSSSDEEYNIF